jgi:hypothetical protein
MRAEVDAAHESGMNENLAPAARGIIVGVIVLLIGLAAAGNRFLTLNATTDSLFFTSLFFTAGGAALIIRTITIARRRHPSAR